VGKFNPDPSRCQSDDHASNTVGTCSKKIPAPQKHQRFDAEGGKCRESAKESRNKKKSKFEREKICALAETVKQSDGKASENVYEESPERKAARVAREKISDKITQNRSDKSADPDE
jgi:hypothetical protein